MCIYSFKITNASTKMLKESVSNIPMSFYVECKNNETEQQCFDKISRKFRQKYGIIIESADVEQINEGAWDKLKAKVAGTASAVGQSLKNGKTHVTNTAKQIGNALSGAKKAWNDTNAGKTQSTTNIAQKEKTGSAQLAKSNAQLISLLKSQIGDLKDLVKNVNGNFQSLEANMPDTLSKAWETLQQSISTYSKQATLTINHIKGTKNVKPEENAEKPTANTVANTIAKNGVKSNPVKKAASPQTKQTSKSSDSQNSKDNEQTADTEAAQQEVPATTTVGKPKKARTDKQKAATAKMQAARKAKIEEKKRAKTAPSKEVDDARQQAATEYMNGNPENEEMPTKRKSSKKDPFAPNPFF